jgi:WD40 repeat protein
MHKLEDKLYLLINSRELVVVDIEAKEIDLRVEFSEHNITCIFATKDFFLYGDTFSYLYAIKQPDLFKEDAKNPVLKKTMLQGHTGWILAMYIFHDFLFTCSDDHSIKVWSMPNCRLWSPSHPQRRAAGPQERRLLHDRSERVPLLGQLRPDHQELERG